METYKITIPKPCHEDWNKMSPEDQGRFCDKCCKTVLDFSSKSSSEVQQFIHEHQNEKLCGRFSNDQLSKPVRLEIPYHALYNRLTTAQAFLVSLFFVFSVTLFSCTTLKNETVGELVLIDAPPAVLSPPAPEVIVTTGFFVTPVVSDSDQTPKKRCAVEEDTPQQELKADWEIDLPVVEITASVLIDRQTSCHSVGLFSYSKAEGIRIQTDEADSSYESQKVQEPSDAQLIVSETLLLYPNPTRGITNLKFNIESEKNVEALLFDLNGKLLRTLIPYHLQPAGESEIAFDVQGLPPSTYLVRLTTGDKVVTKRIVVD